MKPTQEQVIAWALDTGCWETDSGELVVDEMNLTRFAILAYEAGRKDENEACAQIAAYLLKMPENDVSAAIRARGEQ